ncbi:class I SAM-dependent methyltransferase [Spongiivirga citrea]|uniref:Transferase n=1 Tax=Spongiivirga citrea TaxID=1481457 RepID=A0A6M0CI49_9FLAO|nr:transferase [Spongiivirga citrea]NER16633.1 transferase [Spongiivirga citrea]
MYLLFPGRHHLFTSFQYNYISRLVNSGLNGIKDVDNKQINTTHKISGVVFAITSANHSGTKRNPIPFYLRAMMAQEFSNASIDASIYVYGIDDVGVLDDFASYTLKQIKHQSDRRLDLNPANTIVICSTPVMSMYQKLGFKILPAELADANKQLFNADLPWELIEHMANSNLTIDEESFRNKIHKGSYKVWKTYHLEEKVKNILSDPIIGDDGDITESRDYNSYVRQMDEIAEIKFQETSSFIQAGRIGDIGCAVGSWIKQASEATTLFESDFYGIEVARQLFDICNQRKHNGEFANPNVFFAQKNAVTSLVFEEESMNTIHTSSLTHEIESYGNRNDLLQFIENRYAELAPNGVWINRDVIGPENGNELVLMKLRQDDGSNNDPFKGCQDQQELKNYLNGLSTFSRFLRFAADFRKEEQDQIEYTIEKVNEVEYIRLKHRDAADFMLTKDYTDNWKSEMHERFCFWSIVDWKKALQKVGFTIDSATHAYSNPWIVDNRFANKVELYDLSLNKMKYPPTNALIIARKR